MIRYLHKNIKNPSLRELDEYKKGAWVYVEEPSEEELAELVKNFELDQGHLEDALDEDEVPRFEIEGEINYIFTRFIYRDPSLQVSTVPLLIIVGEGKFITVSQRKLPQLNKFINGTIEANTTQRTKLLLQIINVIVSDYDSQINTVSRQIKATRSRLRVEEIGNRDFINFVTIEDELDDFLTALSPTNLILRRLLSGKHLKLFEDDEDLLEDLLLNNEQSIEACRTNLKTIVSIREAYSTIMGNNLNRVIRQLTVLTVIMTVPTIVSGVYGMNVALPFDHHPLAFPIVMFMIAGISVLLLVFFRKQRWF
jgi:magnesium transporter